MGADLTIAKTGTYFRDSYNSSSAWGVLGLSYWDMDRKLSELKLFTEAGNVSVEGVKYIQEQVSKFPFPSMATLKGMKHANESMMDIDEKSAKRPEIQMAEEYAWRKEHDEEMRRFWQEALDNESEVEWSV